MTPDITLNKGQILLTQSTSGLGVVMVNNSFLNGTVALINELSDVWAVGDLVLFNSKDATLFLFEEVTYYLITEDKCFYKENGAP
jgi:hypothetical protein